MRRLVWVLVIVLGMLVLGAVVVYVWWAGLDQADKLASVVGAVCGAGSLVLGIVQLTSGRPEGQPTTVQQAAPDHLNIVRNNLGQVTQAGTVNGPIDMRRHG